MTSSTHLSASNSGVFQFTSTNAPLNGNHIGERRLFPNTNDLGSLGVVPPTQFQNKITIENVDPSQLDDDDSDSDLEIRTIDGTLVDRAHGGSLKPGKKTKGRVKIRMEFIENKLRRYTTFSKRKTGIMKKAYELSTLTGTQVMLLVASETGHVYTFATRKLQPMITSESGKALIQTCLNSPDPHPGQPMTIDQRMNPGGFEETELTYAVGDEEDGRSQDGELKPMMPTGQVPGGIPVAITRQETGQMPALAQVQAAVAAAAVPPTTSNTIQASAPPSQTPAAYIPQVNTTTTSSAVPSKSQAMTSAGVPMQLPNLPSGITILPSGTPIAIPVQQNGQQIISSVSSSTAQQQSQQQQQQQQAVYRIPTPTQAQIPSLTNLTAAAPISQPASTNNSNNNNSNTTSSTVTTANDTNSQLMDLPLNLISDLFAGAPAGTPGIVMYHTPQGVVYATPTTATLPDRSIFNFQTPAQALSVAQPDQPAVSGGQQIITIPVPVSLAGSPQVLFTPTATESNLPVELTSQPTVAKRSRK